MGQKIMKRHLVSALCLLTLANGPAFAETMDEALLSGLVNSDNLNAARQNYIAVRETLTIANSSNDLTGTVTITGAQTETDRKNSSGGFQSSQSLSSRVAISKQLFDSGEGNARIEAANYNLIAAEATYRATEQREILSIIDAYLSLITSRQASALQQENVSRLEAQTLATKIRLEAGTTTATRLAEAEARLARAQSSLISAEAAEENALEKYQSLTGLSGDDLSLPQLSNALPSSLAEAEELAIKNHPDIVVASANERASRMQFDIVARQVLPKVNFSLSATDSQAKGTMQDKLDIKGEVKLTSPLLVTPSSRAKGKEISAKLERAKFQLSEARRNTALNARSALRSTMAAAAQKKSS
jgi:outer membrane protein